VKQLNNQLKTHHDKNAALLRKDYEARLVQATETIKMQTSASQVQSHKILEAKLAEIKDQEKDKYTKRAKELKQEFNLIKEQN
jgi:hypothetical protein